MRFLGGGVAWCHFLACIAYLLFLLLLPLLLLLPKGGGGPRRLHTILPRAVAQDDIRMGTLVIPEVSPRALLIPNWWWSWVVHPAIVLTNKALMLVRFIIS